MSERADDKTIQFGALANPDARLRDPAADPCEAETMQFGAVQAQPTSPAPPKSVSDDSGRMSVGIGSSSGKAEAESDPVVGSATTTTPPGGDPAQRTSDGRYQTRSKAGKGIQTAPVTPSGNRGRFAFGSVGFIVCTAAVVVAVIGAIIAVLLLGGTGSKPLSDGQQVEAAIRNYYAVVRDKGLPAASAISCKEIRDTSSMVPEGAGNVDFKQDITIEKIDNIKISGDTATAQVTGHAQAIVGGQTEADETDSTTLTLQREDGQWKYCTMQE